MQCCKGQAYDRMFDAKTARKQLRAYEKKGDKANARLAYQEVVSSTRNGLERALAYAEAERKLSTL